MLDTKENFKGNIDETADNPRRWAQEMANKAPTTVPASEAPSAGGIMEGVKEQVHSVAAGASGLAGTAKDTAQEWASAVGSAAVHVKDKTRDVASAAAGKMGELGQDLTGLIRRHPFQALLAGFGAGFAVGYLASHVLRRS